MSCNSQRKLAAIAVLAHPGGGVLGGLVGAGSGAGGLLRRPRSALLGRLSGLAHGARSLQSAHYHAY